MKVRFAPVMIILLVAVNTMIATRTTSAHTISPNHWMRFGNPVTFTYFFNVDSDNGQNAQAAQLAISDWDGGTILQLQSTQVGSDISVYDSPVNDPTLAGGFIPARDSTGHFRNVGRSFFDEQENHYDLNNTRAVFCQEIGHAWGLEHSPDGCMGYPSNGLWYPVQHNNNDIFSMYRYAHSH